MSRAACEGCTARREKPAWLSLLLALARGDPTANQSMWASSIAFSRGNVASTSHRCGPIGSTVRRDPAVRVVPGARRHRHRRRRPASSDREDTLSALDRLVPGLSADEAARTPPRTADDEDDRRTVLGDGRVVRGGCGGAGTAGQHRGCQDTGGVRVDAVRADDGAAPAGHLLRGEHGDWEIFVAEIARGSNADAAGVAKVGDVLRAASAMVPEMKYGQGNLLLGERAPGFQACAVRGTQRRRLQAGCVIRSNDRRRGQQLEGRELRRDARVGEKVAR